MTRKDELLAAVQAALATARAAHAAAVEGATHAEARAEMAGETLESAFVVAQIAKALPGMEARGLIGRDELPLTRALCRAISEGAKVEIDFDRLIPDDVT